LKIRSAFVIPLLISLIQGGPAFAACGLHKVKMKVTKAVGSRAAVGRSGNFQISWGDTAEKATITNLKTGQSCDFGLGYFSPDVVYLSSDRSVVMTREGAASNIELSFYDTAFCQPIDSIDISGPTWRLSGRKIFFDGYCESCSEDNAQCACDPATVYGLDDGCHPVFREQESRAYTKKVMGVEFYRPSWIAYPKTKRAKFIKEGVDEAP
jgi:hypothetical protein